MKVELLDGPGKGERFEIKGGATRLVFAPVSRVDPVGSDWGSKKAEEDLGLPPVTVEYELIYNNGSRAYFAMKPKKELTEGSDNG